MLEGLILLTGVAIITISLVGLKKTRDPLFPLMILGPMLLYLYVYMPLTRVSTGAIDSIFPDRDDLVITHVLNLIGVAVFCVGCIAERRPRGIDRRFELLKTQMARKTQNRMFGLGFGMGSVSNAAFFYMIQYTGGWTRVFSRAKPYLLSPSGYIGELLMLSYPAAFVLAVAFQGKRLNIVRIALLLAVLFPQVVMATLGGRRGPMFLVACTLVGCWCIIRGRLPKVKWVITGLGAIGVLLILLQQHRGDLFKPWAASKDVDVASSFLAPETLTLGDEYICAAATVQACMHHGKHHWGSRYFTIFFVRPIPKQLWPTKYSDLGMGWMDTNPGQAGFTTSEWYDAVGFVPAMGGAPGLIADLFLEFSWGVIPACYLIGRIFSFTWRKWVFEGGIWAILYFEMMILSVFLVTQGVGAWFYRLMIVGFLSWFLGGRNLAKGRRRPAAFQPVGQTSGSPQVRRRHAGMSTFRR
ncbi:MAG: oligosaccharide repeat unit polymerase [Planctomycetaceae bacterium]|nr:oligosaccharide repeat unit polymerase [Planctomycetaceae bacterium]